jgi:hypothetical protein
MYIKLKHFLWMHTQKLFPHSCSISIHKSSEKKTFFSLTLRPYPFFPP